MYNMNQQNNYADNIFPVGMEVLMKHHRNRSLLLFSCLCSSFMLPFEPLLVCSFLIGTLFSSLNNYVDKDTFRYSSILFCSILCLLQPSFLLLLPLLLYEEVLLLLPVDGSKRIILNRICALFPAFFSVPALLRDTFFFSNLFAILFFFCCLLSILLCRDAIQYDLLLLHYRQTRDEDTERNLLLAAKNTALMEQQNREIDTATLKERNRIARDIHDNVGHLLSRSILLTGAVRTLARDPVLASPLQTLEQTLTEAMNSIRNSVHDLHDDSIRLEEATATLLSDFLFCPVQFTYDMSDTVPKEVTYCFLAVLKESLSNITRHSNASEASVIMREHPGLYQLCIEDNGGITGNSGIGIGLSNMKERVRALSGNLNFDTQNGFRIFITIPKENIY